MIVPLYFEIKLNIQPPYHRTYQSAASAAAAGCSHLYLNRETAPEAKAIRAVLYLCDTDAAISRYQAAGYPVIGVSHDGNRSASLMGTPWLLLSAEALTTDFLLEVYCRHHHLPLPLFSTARCIVRELSENDLSSLLLLQKENSAHPENGFFPAACENPASFLTDYIRHQYPFFCFGLYAILEKATEQFMGIAGFSSADDLQAEVSYALLQKYQKQGYAEEVLRTLLVYGKKQNGFEQFFARIRLENRSSVMLAEKCGIRIVSY